MQIFAVIALLLIIGVGVNYLGKLQAADAEADRVVSALQVTQASLQAERESVARADANRKVIADARAEEQERNAQLTGELDALRATIQPGEACPPGCVLQD